MAHKNTTLRYVQSITSRGRTYWYFRFRGIRTSLPADPSGADFFARYAELLEGNRKPSAKAIASGTVGALIRDYKQSPEFKGLAPKTQRDYSKSLDHLAPIAKFRASDIARSHIVKLRNTKQTTPRAADLFVAVVSRMFSVGVDLGYRDDNPAMKIGRLAKSEFYLPWPEEARARFEASNPAPELMDAYMIGLWTALRLGDVLNLARSRYNGESFDLRHSKNKAVLCVPANSKLRTYLAGRTRRGLLFVTDADGRRLNETTFGKVFRAHLVAIGLGKYHFHGLRHTLATALAEAGASTKEIQSVTGHRTTSMVDGYTKRADQGRLAASAFAKLEAREARRTGTEQESGKQADESGKQGKGT